MKHFLLLAFLFSFSSISIAKDKFKFGKVSTELLEMTSYALDSTAEAVIMYDNGNSRVDYYYGQGFMMKFKRTVRIKILTEDGLDQANQEIYFSTKLDKITGLKAYTHNLVDGKIVSTKLDKDNVSSEEVSKYRSVRKFTLPQVKVGSVVEFTYNISSESFGVDTWYFQDDIPTVKSEYSFTIPEFLEYKFLPGGYLYPKYEKVNSTDPKLGTIFRHEWSMENVPAFKDESFIASYEDYITKMDFQLQAIKDSYGVVRESYQSSWEKLAKELLFDSEFGGYLNKTSRLKNEVALLSANATTDAEKIGAIYNYVNQNFTWNNSYGIIPGDAFNEVVKTKTGNTAALNLILVGMLQEAGIKAEPVIISTRRNGLINPSYPMLTRMNSILAVAFVEGGQIVMNATNPLRTPNTIAINDRSMGSGITVSKMPQWVNLKTNVKSLEMTYVQGSISPEGEVSANIMQSKSGYYALNARKKILAKGEMKYIEEVLSEDDADEEVSEAEGEDFGVQEASVENLKEIGKPLKVKFHRTIEGEGNMGDRIYVPMFLGLGWKSNPFQKEKRIYPVDLPYSMAENMSISLKIPEGYELESIPKPIRIVLPNKAASFTYNVSSTGNIIQIMSRMNLKKDSFMPEEYPTLREFFTQVFSKHQEQLVLVKKAQ
ncbi:DUF3857 domain-containing protein [Sediminitomix flava]|uniref:Uncharacterized protein DUF3858 n=1 Tax=Sediminitomix flava TaxID=379075 RepID=A0A315ZH86_SEDFL|nr:DUF3857 domain-containing protein [Sediminitomix flava]PWJ44084.1 uncharacterized protein DUF3858 [Sediminitomix flava]